MIGESVSITSAVQLFVDDHLVDTASDVRRTVHPWKKHTANPVLKVRAVKIVAKYLLTKIDICAVVAVAQLRMDLGVDLIVNKTNGSVAKRHVESSWMSAAKLTKP